MSEPTQIKIKREFRLGPDLRPFIEPQKPQPQSPWKEFSSDPADYFKSVALLAATVGALLVVLVPVAVFLIGVVVTFLDAVFG